MKDNYIKQLKKKHVSMLEYYEQLKYSNYINLLNTYKILNANDTTPQEWNSSTAYVGGTKVTYKGNTYEAKWWTKGDYPDKVVTNPWENPWQLATDDKTPNPTPNPNPTQPGEPPDQNTKNVYPDYSDLNVGQGIKWPKNCFAPFIDATGWPILRFADMANSLKVPYFNLGFVVSRSNTICEPTWGTYYPASECPLNDQIKYIRSMGGDVIVSFGGAANTPLQVSAPNVSSLKEQYKRFIKAYGLTRIDFDIEGAWLNDTNSLVRNSKALKMLQDELKKENYSLQIWYTLPVLPTGLTQDGINSLRYLLNEGVNLDGVNVMTMDYGDSVAPNPQGKMAEYGIQAITNLQKQLKLLYSEFSIPKTDAELWNMVGTTPMIGMNDVTTEIFTLTDAKETLSFAEQKSIGMISMWSLNRDKQCPGGVTRYVSISCSSILQDDYEFSSIFNEFNDLSNFNPNQGSNPNLPPTPGGIPVWSPSGTYLAGDKVTYKGKTYKAKWWSQGNNPEESVKNPWETPWELIS